MLQGVHRVLYGALVIILSSNCPFSYEQLPAPWRRSSGKKTLPALSTFSQLILCTPKETALATQPRKTKVLFERKPIYFIGPITSWVTRLKKMAWQLLYQCLIWPQGLQQQPAHLPLSQKIICALANTTKSKIPAPSLSLINTTTHHPTLVINPTLVRLPIQALKRKLSFCTG